MIREINGVLRLIEKGAKTIDKSSGKKSKKESHLSSATHSVHNRKLYTTYLYNQGFSKEEIAQFWGTNKATITRYINAGFNPSEKVIEEIEEIKEKHQCGDLEAVKIIYSKLENPICYIATAAYGSNLAFEVDVLRVWRDETLSKYCFGKYFIQIYYFISPFLANLVKKSNFLNFLSKSIISIIINLIRKNEK